LYTIDASLQGEQPWFADRIDGPGGEYFGLPQAAPSAVSRPHLNDPRQMRRNCLSSSCRVNRRAVGRPCGQ
jgi:hypothetical protein